MAMITIEWQGDGVTRMTTALTTLGSNRVADAARRALNHTGDKARTRVKRALSQQIRAPQTAIEKYGPLRSIRANYANLTYTIVCKGGPIPLKHFGARQTKKGVSAAPWGNRKIYKSAFIAPAAGSHAFWRKGKERLPIERIAGPNVPKEMVKDQSAAAFYAVSAGFAPRMEHELRAITKGVVS